MLNHITAMGRLTKDPELRRTPEGTAVTAFTVAVSRDYGDSADFLNCVAWRNTAEFIARNFGKGKMIIISGRLQSRKWTDRDGQNRTSYEINCDSVWFGETKKTEAEREKYITEPYAEVEPDGFDEISDYDGELPF